MMLLYRLGPEGFFAAGEPGEPSARLLYSDPFAELAGSWRLGGPVELATASLLPPVLPGKIVGIGRNYRDHAREMNNPVPTEPLLFLKSPSSLAGPNTPVVLPPESERVEYEGEIAVVLRGGLRRASAAEARSAVLGVTCACDVTARDLQGRDATFARAKSFDTFCPLGPAIWVGADLEELAVVTRVNGAERQRGHVRDMVFPIAELLTYTSRMMTLEPRDVLLTGTPAGVGPLAGGDQIEVEIPGLGVLRNPVEAWQPQG
ncbi:MAG TPA: fumarylacetoacetate hydrolase family protein [Thermoanaerobaculia bacterium]|nr:fumarylacetoacetate hydrolase family protein [Thermoanaerobaculia bacterium]